MYEKFEPDVKVIMTKALYAKGIGPSPHYQLECMPKDSP